ncbi:MAG: hypothetical protein E7485_08265 [Ruminococcaceae bacterium]|nr:hypothetical protein [Oscillospiraceae bacterium]
MAKKLMVSALGNRIYLTNVKPSKTDPEVFVSTGSQEDYTDEAIRAVFEWFMNNHKANEPNAAYEIRFKGCPYVLTMTKESKS